MDIGSTTKMSPLEAIRSYATSMMQRLSKLPARALSPVVNSLSAIPDFSLAIPTDILQPITRLRIPKNLRTSVSRRFDIYFTELQRRYSAAYLEACKVTAGSLIFNDLTLVREAYQAHFLRHQLPSIQSQIALVTSKADELQTTLSTNGKRRFNNDFTPVFEHYFQYCAYPPRLHRVRLAQASRMTPQQVAVWFQNHRTRSRKDGKHVNNNRLPTDLVLKRALAKAKLGHEDSLSSTTQITSRLEALCSEVDPSRPSHVFPAPFSPSDPKAPHGDDCTFKFPPSLWRRRPHEILAPQAVPIDMEEFVAIFRTKLTFLDKRRRASPLGSSESQPWFSSTVTVPSAGFHTPGKHGSIVLSESLACYTASLASQFPPSPGQVASRNAFQAFVGSKPLPFFNRETVGDQNTIPAWKPTSRVASYSSEASCGSLSLSSASNDTSPEPATPPQLPEQDVSLQLGSSIPPLSLRDQDTSAYPALGFNRDEFVPDEYDFSVFDFNLFNHPDFIQHPDVSIGDYNVMSPVLRHIPLPDKQTPIATVDPSQLILSSIPRTYPSYLAACS
ncbi:hypothetical protein D9613_002219 [Agrocybe pediades]|uniref:Homeobox domain-containing protein n=1 Tax=Agrocybe pediades TaxID=84607 RepID=A0A8H4VUQ3_9AGAR|nr:hypothetical protein D9613_002219 [Agrocybe pediades]